MKLLIQYLLIFIFPFSSALSQTINQLDLDYGISNIKLGTHIDTLKKLIELDGPVYDNGSSIKVRYEIKNWKEFKFKNEKYLKIQNVDMNLYFYLYFVNNYLYQISMCFKEQPGSKDILWNYFNNRYGKKDPKLNDGGLIRWETSKTRLQVYLNDDDHGRFDLFAKNFEPLKKPVKPIKKELKPLKQFYISNKPMKVPEDRVWYVTHLDKGSYFINLVIIYDTIDSEIPLSYSQVMDNPCSLIIGDVQSTSDDVLYTVAEHTESNPITQLPIRFNHGFEIRTKSSKYKLLVQEWKLSDWNEKYPEMSY